MLGTRMLQAPELGTSTMWSEDEYLVLSCCRRGFDRSSMHVKQTLQVCGLVSTRDCHDWDRAVTRVA